MKFKYNLLFLYILLSVITLSLITYKNPTKTTINLFTWKSKEISLGTLINISFITGFALSTFYLISNSTYQNSNIYEKKVTHNDLNDKEDQESYKMNNEDISKPPERDVRESQPTISVNYRVVSQNKHSINNDELNKDLTNNDYNDDWAENENEW